MKRLSVFERDEIVSAIEKEVMDKFGKQSQEIIMLKDEIGELKALSDRANMIIERMSCESKADEELIGHLKESISIM